MSRSRLSGRPRATAPSDGPTVSRDAVFQVLANRRRRYIIHYLKSRDERVDLGTLAERVAGWEHGIDTDRLSSTQRKNVYTALQQRHLPRMDETGLVSFDRRAGTVEPTELLAAVDIYAEVVPSGDFPWSHYYLGLSAITLALLVAVWTDLPPLTAVSDVAWGVFCVTAFAVSAAVHVVATRRMKLGTAQEPPEVKSK